MSSLSIRSLLFGAFCMVSGIVLATIFKSPPSDIIPAVIRNRSPLTRHHDELSKTPQNETQRMKATFVTLTRNSDLWELVRSIRSVEDRFNHHHHYDWVFLNDVPFDDEFKAVTSSLTSGNSYYGLVPKEHWSYPSWIDQSRAAQVRKETATRYMYGDSESYRHMCRFFSGFFFRHEMLEGYEYYWRVEPETELHCDVDFDPFRYMKEEGKKYGFVVSMYEFEETVKSLWQTVKGFVRENPGHVPEGNSLGFISDDGGETYNQCHFWSNFEIGSLDWLRSQQYLDFFDHLDKEGGFFYERWGDAPVHSIAASLLLKKEEVHFFNEIAYSHPPFLHCPTGEPLKRQLKCHCSQKKNVDWMEWSCLPKFFQFHQLPKPSGYEEELPLIAAEAARLVEDDALAEADQKAQARRGVRDDRMTGNTGSEMNQHVMLDKTRGKGNGDDIESLRAEIAGWKRIVQRMVAKQKGKGMGRPPLRKKKGGREESP